MDWKKDPDQALKVADIIREIVDEYRSDVHGQTVDLVCGWFEDYADRLSPVETYPKYMVYVDNYGTDVAYIRYDGLVGGEAFRVDGAVLAWCSIGVREVCYERDRNDPVLRLATEAEAKAHLEPEPPKGKKLTGEFRVPTDVEWWVSPSGVGAVPSEKVCCARGITPDENFNGGKRWILEDDDTCPTCHGKGTV